MRIKGSIDPVSVADMWMRSRPRGDDRSNQMEMWSVVGTLSDMQRNADAILRIGRGSAHGEEVLYERDLCGGLVSCSSDSGRDIAKAGITMDRGRSTFEFAVMERTAGVFLGGVFIFPSPLVYGIEDKAMLYGIIQHELRHYMDFLDNNRKPIESDYMSPYPGGFELDIDAYSRNITEMRAHADQAANLLRIMGGAENAKKAVRDSEIGKRLIPEMAESIMAFIDALEREGKSPGVKESIDPPAVVARAEDYEVRALVGHLERMCEVMKFSNNVRSKR